MKNDQNGNSEQFDSIRDAHLSLAKRLVSADEKKMYQMDIFGLAVLKRSMSVSSGFFSMFAQGNLLCAASLVRLQIDSSLRFFASSLVDDPDGFCKKFFEGIPIRRIKDRAGNAMTDSYLVEKLSRGFPWIEEVYGHASGFIHFSEKHIFSAVSLGAGEGAIKIEVSDIESNPDPVFSSELKVAFMHATLLVLQCVGEWVKTKENREKPEDASFFGTVT
ncbi:MAG: hypothetical protein ACTHOH_00740 [Lysobacteraceae bacterium]